MSNPTFMRRTNKLNINQIISDKISNRAIRKVKQARENRFKGFLALPMIINKLR